MAKIPSVSNLAQTENSVVTQVNSADTSQVGGGTQQLANALGDIVDSRQKYQMSKAQSAFLKLKVEQDNAYKRDEDYSTIPTRYNDTMNKGLSEIASTIGSSKLRDEFMARNTPVLAQGSEQIKDLAWGKELDFERSEINGHIEQLAQTAVNGDMVESNIALEELLQAAEDNDFITNEERQEKVSSFRQNVAISKIKTFEPEDRIEALKQPWANNIPADVKAELQRGANAAAREIEAVNIVDSLQGLGQSAASRKILNIKDVRLRKEVETRHDYMVARDKRNRVDTQDRIIDKYVTMHLDPDSKFNYGDVTEGELSVLTGAQQEQLYNLAMNTDVKPTKYNGLIQDELLMLKTQAERGDSSAWVRLREVYTDNFSNISVEQQKQWSKVTIEGLIPPEVDDELVTSARIKSYLNSANIDNDQIEGDLTLGVARFKRNLGRPATDVEVDDYINRMVKERKYTGPSDFFESTDRLIDMDDDEVKELTSTYVSKHPKDMRLAADFLRSSLGVNVTNTDQILYVDRIQEVRNKYGSENVDDVLEVYRVVEDGKLKFRPVSISEIEAQTRRLLRNRQNGTNE